jgi:glycosyltransferase involved in cell wall biosynthesis/VanZ family protein
MNVLILSEPGESGVFTFVEALCHYLAGEGVSVHLGYSDRRGSDRLTALVRFIEDRGGLTVNMAVGSGLGLGDVRAALRLARLAARVRPDVVHCHSSKAGALGRMLAFAGCRAAFVYHPHAYYGMRPARGSFDALYDAVEACLGRIGTTIVVSSDEGRFASGILWIPAHRIRLIANGIDLDRFKPAPPEEKRALRESFGIPAGVLVLGSMSRMSAQKDPVTLYQAFAATAAERPDIHLFHVGSGELEPQVDKLVSELGIAHRITRLRYLTDPTGFYKAVDGFILTSTYEGLSLASLEALSANLPMVLSAAPGNSDVLELPLTHAWGARPGRPGDFARCIGAWHDSFAQAHAPNHRAIAAARYDHRNSLASVLSLYGEVAPKGNPVAALSARLPPLLFLALIAFESTDRFSRANTRRMLFPLFHFLTGVSSADFNDWNYAIRKVGHFVAYGTLSALLSRLARFEGLGGTRVPRALACAATGVIGTVLVAALDEWHQTTIPSRTGTVADVLLDGAAAVAVQALLYAFAMRPWPRSRPSAGTDPGRTADLPVEGAAPRTQA